MFLCYLIISMGLFFDFIVDDVFMLNLDFRGWGNQGKIILPRGGFYPPGLDGI